MSEKISCVKLSDGNIYSFFDKQGVHWQYVEGQGFILMTGDPATDAKILTDGLHIVECNGENIENLLTYKDGAIKTRKIEYIWKDIGGRDVDANGVLTLPTPTSPTDD